MKVNISPYDPSWPLLFDAEKKYLLKLIDQQEMIIEHIGSTAVPGLAAKPVIDILAGITSLDLAEDIIEVLKDSGYIYISSYEEIMPERRFLYKDKEGIRCFNMHMVQIDSAFWKRHIAFRDHLREHENTRKKYHKLKLALSELDWRDGNEYADAKNEFIRGIEKRIIA